METARPTRPPRSGARRRSMTASRGPCPRYSFSGALLDAHEHLAFHHQRARLHERHRQAKGGTGAGQPVARDQARPALAIGVEHEGPCRFLRLPLQHEVMLRLDGHDLEALTLLIEAHELAHLQVLELRQNSVRVLDVDAEQALDPVVGVDAGARPRAHLHQPGPDRVRRRVYRDRARRLQGRLRQDIVAGHGPRHLVRRGAPVQHPRPAEAPVSACASARGNRGWQERPYLHAIASTASVAASSWRWSAPNGPKRALCLLVAPSFDRLRMAGEASGLKKLRLAPRFGAHAGYVKIILSLSKGAS